LGVWSSFNILQVDSLPRPTATLHFWGDVEIARNFAKNLRVPSFGELSQPNGSTYENGKIFFQKRDNRATLW